MSQTTVKKKRVKTTQWILTGSKSTVKAVEKIVESV